jgi:hypothetical protein
MTKNEKEEFYDLQKYIQSCSGGDRPMSPKAASLTRYLELKEKFYEENIKDSDFCSEDNCKKI